MRAPAAKRIAMLRAVIDFWSAEGYAPTLAQLRVDGVPRGSWGHVVQWLVEAGYIHRAAAQGAPLVPLRDELGGLVGAPPPRKCAGLHSFLPT